MEKKQQDNLKDNREMVTCIIPTYRQMDYLLDSIKSVLLQDYPCIELIITDDASDNFNEALIREQEQRAKETATKNAKEIL